MKFFKRIIGLLLFFTCMGYPAEAKVIHQDMCQMSTAYEDQMHKIADFEKGAFKGRFALMDGQCSGLLLIWRSSLIIMEGSKRLFLMMKEYRK